MDNQKLDRLLRRIDGVEKLQRETGENVNTLHLEYGDSGIPIMPSEDFFKGGNIFVNRSRRFSYTPAHRHSFIEFNYMYSGHCTQYINDEKIVLRTGDMILLDKGVVQKIDYIGEDDILVNIGVQDDSILDNILRNLTDSDNLVTRFMMNASSVDAVHNSFILFSLHSNWVATNLVQTMIGNFFIKERDRNRILNLLLSALLVELANMIELRTNQMASNSSQELAILQYIDANYPTLTLRELAKHFGYNRNYLGNKLKKMTKSTFQELIDKKRLDESRILLSDTNYSIEEIAQRVGFKSTTSLYKLYRAYLNSTPNQIRQR